MTTRFARHLAGLSIALVLNISACEMGGAAAGSGPGPGSAVATGGATDAKADSTRMGADSTATVPAGPAGPAGARRAEAPVPSVSAKGVPLVTSEDGLDLPGAAIGRQAEEPAATPKDAKARSPIYRNKWLWAAGAGVLIATLIAVAAGSGGKSAEELPDFPQPPTR
jgi:hypothetical protein